MSDLAGTIRVYTRFELGRNDRLLEHELDESSSFDSQAREALEKGVFMMDVDVCELGWEDREALLAMYREFDPLGVAQGLPPVSEQGRHDWIDRVLRAGLNLGACLADRRILGHTILAPSGPCEAEIAFFVHQDHREKGLGTRMVNLAVDRSKEMQMRRLWASVYADNVPALRLLRGRGFTICTKSLPTLELELLLPEPQSVSMKSF